MAMRDGLPQATTPTPLNPNAFADMVERHLKQMATDRGAAADAGDGRVLLRMADATLPGTDLLLSRTSEGWVLRADVRSRSSFDAIRDAAPALARRFAERNLGTLSNEIGRAHVCTPVTNSQLVCRLLLEKKFTQASLR